MEPVVWIIQRDHWPRASLRAELIERGLDAVGFETVRDAIAALSVPGQARPLVAVVDLASQEAEIPQLAALTRAGCRMVGIGSAVETIATAGDISWSVMLRRPVSLGTIADAVQAERERGAGATTCASE
jgi:hypothetical protein